MGQGVNLLQYEGKTLKELGGLHPFYSLMPGWFLLTGIVIATLAAIIASQAMISGSFTLISEALRLNVWPKVKVKYPTETKGQLYVPSANLMLWVGCMAVVLYFRESSRMEHAYGLSIVITFLMSTILLANYLRKIHVPKGFVFFMLVLYLTVEGSFLVAQLEKFVHGGWAIMLIS
jgi:KUP system potassium uptake protein